MNYEPQLFDSYGDITEEIATKKFDALLPVQRGKAGEAFLRSIFYSWGITFVDVSEQNWRHDFEVKDTNHNIISKIQVKAVSARWHGYMTVDFSGYEKNSFDVACIVSLAQRSCIFMHGQEDAYNVSWSLLEEKDIDKRSFKDAMGSQYLPDNF